MMRRYDWRIDSLCATPTDARNKEKSANHKIVWVRRTEILRAAHTNALIYFPLAGSTHSAFCAPILPKECWYFRGKREPLKKGAAQGKFHAPILLFKRLLFFHVETMETEIHCLAGRGLVMKKKSVQCHGPIPLHIDRVYFRPSIHLAGHSL